MQHSESQSTKETRQTKSNMWTCRTGRDANFYVSRNVLLILLSLVTTSFMVILDSGISFVQSKPNSIMDAMHISLSEVICSSSEKRLASTTSIILPENDCVIHFLKSRFSLHISSSVGLLLVKTSINMMP